MVFMSFNTSSGSSPAVILTWYTSCCHLGNCKLSTAFQLSDNLHEFHLLSVSVSNLNMHLQILNKHPRMAQDTPGDSTYENVVIPLDKSHFAYPFSYLQTTTPSSLCPAILGLAPVVVLSCQASKSWPIWWDGKPEQKTLKAVMIVSSWLPNSNSSCWMPCPFSKSKVIRCAYFHMNTPGAWACWSAAGMHHSQSLKDFQSASFFNAYGLSQCPYPLQAQGTFEGNAILESTP